jgi:hypothetical protein
MLRPLLALAFLFIAGPALAQTATPLFPMASTPNIALSGSASVSVTVPAGPARFVYIKNDCSTDLFFDLRGRRDASANIFPLRLKTNQEFSANMQVFTVAASNPNGTACTFTLQFGQ